MCEKCDERFASGKLVAGPYVVLIQMNNNWWTIVEDSMKATRKEARIKRDFFKRCEPSKKFRVAKLTHYEFEFVK